MKLLELIKLSVHKKLIGLFMIALFISTSTIGITGYLIARDSLDKKGEIILENSVIQAIEIIDANYKIVENGILSESEAQERIKEILLGTINKNGTRFLHQNINLGDNGYMIIYDEVGNEIMHPTLEGENVWDVVDYSKKDHFIVREQIHVALNGGGFSYYDWMYPHSDKIGNKISYSLYYPKWGWIVVATAYKLDFNAEANKILVVLIISMGIIFIFMSIAIVRYVMKIIGPIIEVSEGMCSVGTGEYRPISIGNSRDEIEMLVTGYNKMIDSLIQAEKNIVVQNERFHYLAYHDELTNMPNRHGFREHVSKRLKYCESGYIIQMDIMGLKVINSTMGFDQGDHLLKLLGEFFNRECEKVYFSARTSSSEFSIWIEDFEILMIKEVVYKIRDSINIYLESKKFNHIIDMYLSMSIFPSHGDKFDILYEEATMAMKQAKENNDFTINIYESKIKIAIENEILMRKNLNNAIINNEIVPYYQEKVDYTTGKVVGVEALARWNSPDLGYISPAVFIPALHQLNLINNFTDYMIVKVLSDYKKIFNKYNEEITVSINIPSSYFLDKEFYSKIKDYIEKSQVPANKIILEITEDIFIADYDKISNVITMLHNLGVKISIDDFGTGYSSLNYLTNINFDELKIDKTFIDQIIENDKVFKLFEVLCNIAEIYGYEIVAEGVETEHQLKKIESTSLKIIQGYIYSKPEPLI